MFRLLRLRCDLWFFKRLETTRSALVTVITIADTSAALVVIMMEHRRGYRLA
jgi:hypothetical protein